MYWLLEQESMQRYDAMKDQPIGGLDIASLRLDDDALQVSADGAGHVLINGILTNTPDLRALLFGGGNTTYPQIQKAIADAEADPAVEKIILEVNSPGGSVMGAFETAAVIASASKPVEAMVHSIAASGAYLLASQAQKITAMNKASTIGSIGVVSEFNIDPTKVRITSTNAPDKAPDVTTETGKAAMLRHIDAVHALMVKTIGEGRGVSEEKINSDFGRGGLFLAEQAKRAGMIDEIVPAMSKSVKSDGAVMAADGKLEMEDSGMPDKTYEEGLAAGRAQEKARVIGHLGLAEKSGAMDLALAAIKGDNAVDAAAFEAHMEAKTKDKELQAREGEDKSVAPAATAATPAPAGNDGREARVAAETARIMGYAPAEVK